MLVSLKNLFNPGQVATSLSLLPDLQTTVMDDFFKQRPTHPSPMVGLDMLTRTVGTIPVVSREGQAIPLGGDERDIMFVAPLPLKPSVNVTAAELNDLKAMFGDARTVEQWRANKLDRLRRVVRDTTEAMAAVTLTTGKVNWPKRLSGGNATYAIDYGDPLTFTPTAKLTADSKIRELYQNILQPMTRLLRRKGVGGRVEFRCGEDVFAVLLDMAENFRSTADRTISVSLESGAVRVGGYTIKELSETYPSPEDGELIPKLDPKTLLAVAADAPGMVWYCAIDSISANNAATQFHVVPELLPGDTGYQLIAQSKPLPARNPNTVCKAVVVN